MLFLGILCSCIVYINSILIPKYVDDNNFPTSATFYGFYEMKNNSVDVIFLGSSRASCAFSPQELYNMYGIRSYNLGCEMQNMLVSYYWLKEALRYQKPKVVVLETSMSFLNREDEPLNTSIECTRKALDYMKWSANKYQAVKDICKYDESQEWESYVFPNIQYHARWEELDKNDWKQEGLLGNNKLKGQTVLRSLYANWDNEEKIVEGSTNEIEKMHVLMEVYLDKIVSLCRDENIELILVSVPTGYDSNKKYNALCEYAEKKEVLFIDYNEKYYVDKLGYDFVMDNAEYSHVGIRGVIKINKHLGELLLNKYEIVGVYDEQWEISREYYEQTKNNFLD